MWIRVQCFSLQSGSSGHNLVNVICLDAGGHLCGLVSDHFSLLSNAIIMRCHSHCSSSTCGKWWFTRKVTDTSKGGLSFSFLKNNLFYLFLYIFRKSRGGEGRGEERKGQGERDRQKESASVCVYTQVPWWTSGRQRANCGKLVLSLHHISLGGWHTVVRLSGSAFTRWATSLAWSYFLQHFPIYLSVCPSVCPSIHLFIHLFTSSESTT